MKRNIFLTALLASLVFIGCKKDDGPLAKADGLSVDQVPFMRITKVAGFTADIIPSTIASYVGKIKVEMHYAYSNPNLTPPDKVDLVIIKNGDKNNVKVLKAGITGPYPVEVTFTGPELVALFGSVVTCDFFQVGYDVYANGKKYEAYPPGGVGNGGATDLNQPGYSVLLNYNTKVEYDPNIYKGNFVVISDAWADFFPGDVVALTQINATQFSFIDPFARDPVPVIVTIDPATLLATITKQVVGSSWAWDAPATYPQPTMSAGGPLSLVAPCLKTLNLNIQFGFNGVAGPIFGGGPYLLKLVKQ